MVPVLEAVPNFSAGRDRGLLDRLIRAATEQGAEVLDASADPDHDRSVLTIVGAPEAVEEAAVAMARIAVEAIDLRTQRGVHPRVGALDVLPFVPLLGLDLEAARTIARRTGERLARELGLPVFFYGGASDPPGRGLAEIRKGGFEGMRDRFPDDRIPDCLPDGWGRPGPHPTAGVTCVGARPVLLAWNVWVEGVTEGKLREVARELRAAGGGVPGLRALGLVLPRQEGMQISMNLEDAMERRPFEIFEVIEARVAAAGGRVTRTEVIGLIPDALVTEAGTDRLRLEAVAADRLLSRALEGHLFRRLERDASDLRDALEAAAGGTPAPVRETAGRLIDHLSGLAPRRGTA